MNLPLFIEGVHYRELRGPGKYRFELLEDITFEVQQLRDINHTDTISFRDAHGTEWMLISGFQKTIRKGYRWNGGSPKWWVWPFGWVGTPDPPKTRRATLSHDPDFQFLRTEHFPLLISECNDFFESILVAEGFPLAHTWHGAVTDFGERFSRKYPKRGEHSILL